MDKYPVMQYSITMCVLIIRFDTVITYISNVRVMGGD